MTRDEYRDNIVHALRMEFEIPQWIEFYNKYLSDVGCTERSIVEMDNFNDWTESYSHLDIAKMIHDGDGEFNPYDEYFYIGAFPILYSFSCADDDVEEEHIFLDDLANWMIENNETFGEDVFGKLLEEYVSNNAPLNCEFVVLETDDKDDFTVGKIYKVENGKLTNNKGDKFPLYSELKTFDDLVGYLSEGNAYGVFYGGENKILRIVR